MSDSNEQKSTTDEQKQTSGGYADEIIEGHSYDGIQEYDNPMPLWWKAVFIVTIIWSPIYIGLLESGFIDTYQESLYAEDQFWEKKIEEYQKQQPDLTPERIVSEFNNSERVEDGKKIYVANCAACHGDKGEGLIGPNLTDKFWLHGGDPESIYKTINEGILAKGMPAWGSVLSPEDILNVGSFIVSMRNTDVPGKAPQGEPYVPDGEDADAPADDSGDTPDNAEANPAEDDSAADDSAKGDSAEDDAKSDDANAQNNDQPSDGSEAANNAEDSQNAEGNNDDNAKANE